MYEAEITAAASAICAEESELLGLLCAAASEELESRLRSGVRPDMCSEMFITASALIAVSTYNSVCIDLNSDCTYRAGSVSVTARDSAKSAAAAAHMRAQAEAMMSPYIVDDNFRFMGVDA